ncbi:MAG: hypothetical protein QXY40_04995 [Candidatus Methanomethylicia archaeon]
MSRIPIYVSAIILLALFKVYAYAYPYININHVLSILIYYPFHRIIPSHV